MIKLVFDYKGDIIKTDTVDYETAMVVWKKTKKQYKEIRLIMMFDMEYMDKEKLMVNLRFIRE